MKKSSAPNSWFCWPNCCSRQSKRRLLSPNQATYRLEAYLWLDRTGLYQREFLYGESLLWLHFTLQDRIPLRIRYGLSDLDVEEQIKDSLFIMRFLDLSLEDTVSDSTTICRFRNALVRGALNDRILFDVNCQLAPVGVMVKSGIILNVGVTDSSRRLRGGQN